MEASQLVLPTRSRQKQTLPSTQRMQTLEMSFIYGLGFKCCGCRDIHHPTSKEPCTSHRCRYPTMANVQQQQQQQQQQQHHHRHRCDVAPAEDSYNEHSETHSQSIKDVCEQKLIPCSVHVTASAVAMDIHGCSEFRRFRMHLSFSVVFEVVECYRLSEPLHAPMPVARYAGSTCPQWRPTAMLSASRDS